MSASETENIVHAVDLNAIELKVNGGAYDSFELFFIDVLWVVHNNFILGKVHLPSIVVLFLFLIFVYHTVNLI